MNMQPTSARTSSVLLAAAVVLVACGGGSDDTQALVTPNAAAFSTFPSASAPANYATVYAGGYGTASSVIENGVRRITDISAPLQMDRNRISFAVSDLGANGWMVDSNGFQQTTFAPSTRSSPPASALFDSFRLPQEGLDIAKPGAGGLSRTYSGILLYTWADQDPSKAGFTFLAAGSPTRVNPPADSGSYAGVADGFWFDGTTTRRLFGSPATVTVDASGDWAVVLALRGHDDAFGAFESAPTTVLGTASGMAGSLTSTGGYVGGFNGVFFGPSAAELGIAFTLTGPGDARAFGVIVARR